MAWTAPRTWVTAETVTAGLMNTHVRDNLSAAFPYGDAWQDWTPGEILWTLGNGTRSGRYMRIGDLIIAQGSIILGSTSAVKLGFSTTYPVTPAVSKEYGAVGDVLYVHHTGNPYPDVYPGSVVMVDANRLRFYCYPASSTYLYITAATPTVPFTFTTSDEVHWSLAYEAA